MNDPARVPLSKAEQDALVVKNVALVIHISSQFHNLHVDHDERIGWGNLGLIRAARDFDPERGVKFSSYAGWWIRAYMLSAMAGSVGMSTNGKYRKVFFGLRRATRAIEATGAVATDEAIALELDVDTSVVSMLRSRLTQGDLRIDGRRLDELSASANDSFLVQYGLVHHQTPEDEAIKKNERASAAAEIRIAMRGMNHREREVINRRYLTDDPETLHAIGLGWGVSREWVRQIETKAMVKLRRGLMRLRKVAK